MDRRAETHHRCAVSLVLSDRCRCQVSGARGRDSKGNFDFRISSFEFRISSLRKVPTRWKVSKPVRLALYLVENLLVLALAALIVMSSAWFQQFLERRVIASLESLTGGRVEIGHFRFKPWLFQITLQKLVIHGPEAAGDPPLVSVGDVEVGLSPGQFLHPRLRLRHVDMDGLQVHVRTNPQGVTNLPVPRQRTSPREGLAGLMDLSIGRLTLSHSALFWNDQSQPVELDARDLAVLLRLARGRYDGAISSSAIAVRSSRWSSPPIKFNSRFELSPASLVFSSFAWQAQGTAGEAYFTITLHPQWRVSGSFHASAELPALAGILHAPELRAGTLQIEGLATYQGGIDHRARPRPGSPGRHPYAHLPCPAPGSHHQLRLERKPAQSHQSPGFGLGRHGAGERCKRIFRMRLPSFT